MVLLHIGGACFSENPANFFGFDLWTFGLAESQLNEFAHKGDHSDVVSRRGFYGYHVAHLERQVCGVSVVSLSGVFELHFHEVAFGVSTWDVLEPVEAVEL